MYSHSTCGIVLQLCSAIVKFQIDVEKKMLKVFNHEAPWTLGQIAPPAPLSVVLPMAGFGMELPVLFVSFQCMLAVWCYFCLPMSRTVHYLLILPSLNSY